MVGTQPAVAKLVTPPKRLDNGNNAGKVRKPLFPDAPAASQRESLLSDRKKSGKPNSPTKKSSIGGSAKSPRLAKVPEQVESPKPLDSPPAVGLSLLAFAARGTDDAIARDQDLAAKNKALTTENEALRKALKEADDAKDLAARNEALSAENEALRKQVKGANATVVDLSQSILALKRHLRAALDHDEVDLRPSLETLAADAAKAFVAEGDEEFETIDALAELRALQDEVVALREKLHNPASKKRLSADANFLIDATPSSNLKKRHSFWPTDHLINDMSALASTTNDETAESRINKRLSADTNFVLNADPSLDLKRRPSTLKRGQTEPSDLRKRLSADANLLVNADPSFDLKKRPSTLKSQPSSLKSLPSSLKSLPSDLKKRHSFWPTDANLVVDADLSSDLEHPSTMDVDMPSMPRMPQAAVDPHEMKRRPSFWPPDASLLDDLQDEVDDLQDDVVALQEARDKLVPASDLKKRHSLFPQELLAVDDLSALASTVSEETADSRISKRLSADVNFLIDATPSSNLKKRHSFWPQDLLVDDVSVLASTTNEETAKSLLSERLSSDINFVVDADPSLDLKRRPSFWPVGGNGEEAGTNPLEENLALTPEDTPRVKQRRGSSCGKSGQLDADSLQGTMKKREHVVGESSASIIAAAGGGEIVNPVYPKSPDDSDFLLKVIAGTCLPPPTLLTHSLPRGCLRGPPTSPRMSPVSPSPIPARQKRLASATPRLITHSLTHHLAAESPIFSGINENQRATLVDAFKERSVSKGEVVINEGDIGEHFYVARQGEYAVLLEVFGSTPVHRYRPGGSFGEVMPPQPLRPRHLHTIP